MLLFREFCDILNGMSSKSESGFSPLVTDVVPMKGYRLWLRFADGSEGVADLSRIPRGKKGSPWNNRREFRRVGIKHSTASWKRDEGTVEFDPMNLYLKATGSSPESLLRHPGTDGRARVVVVEDCGPEKIFVELDTGNQGYVKITEDLIPDTELFTDSEMPVDTSFVLPCGDILWRNKFWVSAPSLDNELNSAVKI